MKKITVYICKEYSFDKDMIKKFMQSKGYIKYTKRQRDVEISNASPDELEPFGQLVTFGIETE